MVLRLKLVLRNYVGGPQPSAVQNVRKDFLDVLKSQMLQNSLQNFYYLMPTIFSKFTLIIHIVTNIFMLCLPREYSDDTTYNCNRYTLLDDNNFYRVTFKMQLGISNFY